MDSWQLPPKSCPDSSKTKSVVVSKDIQETCEALFDSKMSPFQNCYQRVVPKNFLEMCLGSLSQEETCSIALGYIEVCKTEKIELRLPESCVK